MDTLLRCGTLVTMDPGRRIIEDAAVAIRDGVIVDVGPAQSVIDGNPQATNTIDASDKVVIPGLINSHTHACMLFQRTIGFDQPFERWFAETQLPMMRQMSLGDYSMAAQLTMAENLLEGNTTVVENCFFPTSVRDEGSPEAATVAAAETIGTRLGLATSYLTANSDPAFLESSTGVIARLDFAMHEWHRRQNVVVIPSLLLPWATDRRTLEDLVALARAAGAMMHFHCAETPYYNRRCREDHGARSNVDLLASVDALGDDVQLVGCSEIDDTDMDLIAETGTRVISVPTSDLFQSHRPLRTSELLERGVPISFGANGCAGNGRQGMFEAMKDGAGLAKALNGDPTVLGKDEALAMGTIEAARNLGIGDLVGSIEVGKRGDLVALDLHKAHTVPMLNAVAAVVYSARGPDVTDVLVDGEHVIRDGRCVNVDVDELVAGVQDRAEEIAAATPSLHGYLTVSR